jgi:hypothetical protein
MSALRRGSGSVDAVQKVGVKRKEEKGVEGGGGLERRRG